MIESDHDLLSSSYALRMRLESNVYVPSVDSGFSRVPMGEIVIIVPDEEGAFARVRRTSRTSGGDGFRMTVAPNPAGSTAEARFSISHAGYVTLRLVDGMGREVRRVVERGYMDEGRYASWVDLRDLPNGVYLLEAQCDRRRESAQVMVAR